MFLSMCLDIAGAGPGGETISAFKQRAAAIEAAQPDIVILAAEGDDGEILPPKLEALVDSSWITGTLRTPCVVAGLPAGHAVPFHVARALSAVDFLSAGRVGWMPIATNGEEFDGAYGEKRDDADLVARTDDLILATQALWDSWDEDALIIDKQSGEYLDSTKVRRVDYRGKFYSTMGPLNAARPPQGYPVLVRDVDTVSGAETKADIAIGSVASLAGDDAVIKLIRVDASDAAALADAKAAIAAGTANGLHLTGPAALDALTALRAEAAKPAASARTARQSLGLDKPANAYVEGALS